MTLRGGIVGLGVDALAAVRYAQVVVPHSVHSQQERRSQTLENVGFRFQFQVPYVEVQSREPQQRHDVAAGISEYLLDRRDLHIWEVLAEILRVNRAPRRAAVYDGLNRLSDAVDLDSEVGRSGLVLLFPGSLERHDGVHREEILGG